MEEKIFLYREKNNIEDRDACKYVEYKTPENRFECGHYFSSLNLCGSNFWGAEFLPYKDIETFLGEEDYKKILSFNEEIKNYKGGITKGDERYIKGLALWESLEPIFDKLRFDDEAIAFKDKIMESEHEMLKSEYNLSDEDVELILDERSYTDSYEDKGIVCCVYADYEDLGRCFADNFLDLEENVQCYFDFEKYGEDLADDSRFVELSEGRIAELSY